MSGATKYINLIIADRNYRLKISSDEEMLVLKASEQIKVKLDELKHSYRAKDRQDYLAMAALTLAVDAMKQQADQSTMQLLEQKLESTDEMIDKYLKAID